MTLTRQASMYTFTVRSSFFPSVNNVQKSAVYNYQVTPEKYMKDTPGNCQSDAE